MIRDANGNIHGKGGRFTAKHHAEAHLSLAGAAPAAGQGGPAERAAEALSMRPGAARAHLHDADPFVRLAASTGWDIEDTERQAVEQDPPVAAILDRISA